MSIGTYQELITEVQRLLDGDDISASSINVATLETILVLAERKIYREVKSRHNEKAFASVTVTNNLAPIPADWESTSTIHFGKEALRPMPEDWLREYLQTSPSGEARYFAEAGSSFMFGPTVDNGTAVQGRYFCRLPALTRTNDTSNALFVAEPDLFVYAMLSESAEFYPVANRIGVWTAKYEALKNTLNRAKDRAAFAAGRMVVTPSTRLLG